ncbi:MAG TPA: hypothetical protein VN107_07080, partial [Microbacterium sp.]|nr:hypothetical protein [Microbacterium sp.]
MMHIRYAPGEAWAVAAGGRCVVVAGDAAATLIADLHAALADGADLARIVDAFTGAFGASLHSLPPFAAVFPEGDGVRVAVRGAVAVSVDAAGTAHEFTGAGVTTWSERVIDDATGVQVRVADAADPAAYPLADGAALVSALALSRTPASRPESTSRPESPSRLESPSRPEP